MIPDSARPSAMVGGNPPRQDGASKVCGSALFVDDLEHPGMLHGVTVRSPHARALIEEIRIDAALAEGDVTIVTAADLPGPNVLRLIEDDWPVLAESRVNHHGEAVALVAAPSLEAARAAARLVKVSYRPLPAVLTLDDALDGDPRCDGELNVLATCAIDHGDLAQGLERADHILEGVYETGLQEHVYIETQGMLAMPREDGSIELVGSLQCPFYVHKALQHLLAGAFTGVRVRQAVTGGGFGGKEDYPDMIGAHAALLAWKSGRPVKIVYDRQEDISATTKRHPSRVQHRTGLLEDGTLVAMDIDVLLDGGAYVTLSPVVLSRAVLHAAGPYRCPNVRIRGRVLATNMTPHGAFRGFGAPQTQFAMERQMDRVARALGLDPFTIRMRNAYREGDATPTGQVLDESVSAVAVLEEAGKRTDFRRRWAELEAARRNRQPGDGAPLPGLGLSFFWHGSGFTGNGERDMRCEAAVELVAAGRVRVLTASCDFGQGTVVALAQMVAEGVGIPVERVDVAQADTGLVPDSGPTVASRTIMVVGGLLHRAGRELARQLCVFVAHRSGREDRTVDLRDGRFRARDGTDLGSFEEHGAAYLALHPGLRIQERYEPLGDESFDEEHYRGEAYPAYGFGCDVVEVEVDPDTLAVRPRRATIVCDVGRAIHPVLCAGQLEGGTLQALGWGVLEELEVEEGKYLNDRLATYIIPTSMDVPDLETVLLEHPTRANPVGAKGVGELPMDGGAPAIVAAIENATGIAPRAIPATPEALLEHLEAGLTVDGEAAPMLLLEP